MFHLKIHITGMAQYIFAKITVLVKVRIMSMVSKLWLVGLVLVIIPNRPYRQYLVHHT